MEVSNSEEGQLFLPVHLAPEYEGKVGGPVMPLLQTLACSAGISIGMLTLPLPSFSAQDIHPILVNFTAALIPASVASDMLGKIFRKQSLTHAAWWMLVYAAVITPFTALAGWFWKQSVEAMLPPGILTFHQWLGTSLGVLFLFLAGWRFTIHRKDQKPTGSYFFLAFLTLVALVYQGSLGGKMVFP